MSTWFLSVSQHFSNSANVDWPLDMCQLPCGAPHPGWRESNMVSTLREQWFAGRDKNVFCKAGSNSLLARSLKDWPGATKALGRLLYQDRPLEGDWGEGRTFRLRVEQDLRYRIRKLPTLNPQGSLVCLWWDVGDGGKKLERWKYL